MTPRVSIVVPNYNYGRFIAETLDSVIGQTFTDWELIVVDDNSTDESRKIVEGFIQRHPERRISLVINSQGPARGATSGTPTPINIGIRQMHGDYFAWLSSDDIFEPDKLEAQVRFLDENPAVGLVHTAYVAIDANGRQIGDFHPPNEFETDAFTALLDGNFINGNTVLIRRDVLEEVGPFLETDPEFPELWRVAEYYHWLKIAQRGPIACVDHLLHRSRRHAGNADFNGSSMGSALERMFIRRCFEEQSVEVTPEIVAALGGRGLMSVFAQAFERLSDDDRARALQLFRDIEADRESWDCGWHQGVRRLDTGRIQGAFHTKNPAHARSMLEALAGLDRPQNRPCQVAAATRLAKMDLQSERAAV